MYILSDKEINQECLSILDRFSNDNHFYKPHIQLLYNCGLRISEIVQKDNIYRTEYGDLFVWMQKTNRYRIIKKNEFTESFDLENLLQLNQLNYVNEKNISGAIKYFSNYRQLFVGNKEIVTHIFRHNYAKQKYIELESYPLVNEHLQEQNLSVCEKYVNSKIYYKTK